MLSRSAVLGALAFAVAFVVGFVGPGDAVAQGACEAAREEVRAVFGNAAATERFAELRLAGRTPFESVLGLQGANPAARETLLACRAEVTAYLEEILGRPIEAPPVVADLPTVAPGCVVVRWADDFPAGEPVREGAAPSWRVTANVTNNCLKPVLIELCVAFPKEVAASPSRQAQLLDRPSRGDYPFPALSSPTNEYSPSYMVCEIDETCDSCPARGD
jgi:hypothetical protein